LRYLHKTKINEEYYLVGKNLLELDELLLELECIFGGLSEQG
jgi:hypothetical protein